MLRIYAAIIGVLLLSATSGASAENPLVKLGQGNTGGKLCFSRVYDAEHLRRHPGQRTTSAVVSLEYQAAAQGAWLRARFSQKQRANPADVFAGCEWSETANTDTSGNAMLPTFRKDAGFVCIAVYNPSSAEEAGTVLFDLAADGRTVTIHFDDAVGLWSATNRGESGPMLKLGSEDRLFRLDRTDAVACRALERDLQDN